MAEKPIGCGRPTGGVVGEKPVERPEAAPQQGEERTMSNVRVGAKAPDFEAPCFKDGGFSTEKLSDHLGKWVMLCFYPGDFTFV